MPFKVNQIFVERHGDVLTLSQPTLEIDAGEVVQWIFAGVQRDETPTLLVDGAGSGMLGPFTCLRRSQEMVVAKGFSGQAGTFSYRAALVKPAADLASAPHLAVGQGTLAVRPAAAPTGQVIRVQLLNGTLEISPKTPACPLMAGDSMIWQFEVPTSAGSSWVPSIYFVDGENHRRSFGPFASLTAIDGPLPADPGEAVVRRFVVGTSLIGGGGSFSYLAVIRTADGTEYGTSPDPVLDTDGDPVCVGNC